MANETRIEHASETWLADSTVFEVNRIPAHSDHKCYAHDPQTNEWSDLRQSLDGEWRVEVVQASDIEFNEEPFVRGELRRFRLRTHPGSRTPADGGIDEQQVREHSIPVGWPRESDGTEYSGEQPCRPLP